MRLYPLIIRSCYSDTRGSLWWVLRDASLRQHDNRECEGVLQVATGNIIVLRNYRFRQSGCGFGLNDLR